MDNLCLQVMMHGICLRNMICLLILLLVIFHPGDTEVTVGLEPEWNESEPGLNISSYFC